MTDDAENYLGYIKDGDEAKRDAYVSKMDASEQESIKQGLEQQRRDYQRFPDGYEDAPDKKLTQEQLNLLGYINQLEEKYKLWEKSKEKATKMLWWDDVAKGLAKQSQQTEQSDAETKKEQSADTSTNQTETLSTPATLSQNGRVWFMHPVGISIFTEKKIDCCSIKFHRISKIVLRHEGGYVNNPNDSGGATNKGIAWNTWVAYAKKDLGIEPTLENLKQLTDEQAEVIYRKRYWQPKGFCKIENDRLGLMIYDWSITSGGAIKKVQQLLVDEFDQNIDVDGKMGERTAVIINSIADQDNLLTRITEIRREYYTNLAIKADGTHTKNYVFLKGWLNRVDDCLNVKIED